MVVTVTVVDDVVFVCTDQTGTPYGLAVADGSSLWTLNSGFCMLAGQFVPMVRGPDETPAAVFVGPVGLVAVDKAGNTLWTATDPACGSVNMCLGPAVDPSNGDIYYLSSGDGTGSDIVAVNRSGHFRMRVRLANSTVVDFNLLVSGISVDPATQ
jgi:hypothetical protein